jgi:hypothetical protein
MEAGRDDGAVVLLNTCNIRVSLSALSICLFVLAECCFLMRAVIINCPGSEMEGLEILA